MVGVGAGRNTDYTRRSTNEFLVVIGKDNGATGGSAWAGHVGCNDWSSYLFTDVDNMYRRIDDIVGPLTEGSDDVIYLFMRTWTSQSDSTNQ